MILAGAVLAPVAAGKGFPPQIKRTNAYNEALRRAGIEPHSTHPSGRRPYAVCPVPSRAHASCFAAAVPGELAAQHRSVSGGPLLEGSGKDGGYSPTDLRSAYGLPAQGGSGLKIAITIAYDYPKAEADLATYRETYGLPPCTNQNGCFQKINQRGEAQNYPEAAEGWAAEAALDLDITSAICPECKLLLVEADDNSFENLPVAVEKAAELGVGVISDSWGGPEFSEELSLDHYLNHPGIPVLFASGDSGYRAEYPASSPNVIAVGGTSLHHDQSTRGWREMAWIGAGSGCSEYEEKPAWQSDPGCTNRSIADVAAVADPRTPVSIYDTYGYEYDGWGLFGGTSAAAPIMAGVEALSSSAKRAKGAQLFWEEGPEGKLFDPGEGRNGACHGEVEYLCQARLGYDGPTGWGTPGASRPGAPAVATYYPTAVTTTEATLNGAINPNGEETSYRFEYGSTSSYGTSVPASEAHAGSGSDPLNVTWHLSGLARDLTYHYRLVAENQYGTTYGGDQTFETSLWSVQYMPRPEQREGEMFGTSCASPSSCVSVGAQDVVFGEVFGGFLLNPEALVERWDEGKWMTEAVPAYHAAGEGYYSLLAGVSCSTPDFCMAVGENYELPVGYGPLIERWDGTKWMLVPAPLPSDAAVNEDHQYEVIPHGVSCVSATSCVMVGAYTKKWNSLQAEEIVPLIESWDGNKWVAVPSPNPPEDGTYFLWGVSCVSTDFCMAAGKRREGNDGIKTLLERWDGTKWSIVSAPVLSGSFLSVSCSSEISCMAVGATEGKYGGDGIAEMWDGSTWSTVPLEWPMRGVSCLAADWCVAAGGDRSLHAAFAAIWNGTRWLLEYPVAPTDASDTPKEMYGVSCESSGCTAVGWYYSWGYRPLAERLDRSLVAPRPTVANDLAASVTRTSATLNAHVDNNGGVGSSDSAGQGGSDCHFELALRSAPDTPIAQPMCSTNPVEGNTSLAVEAQAAGLEPGTEYVYRVVASNEGGTSRATPDQQFTTLPNPPAVANDSAISITQTSAVLRGHVDNEGASAGSSCKFVVALQSAPATPVAEQVCNSNPIMGDTSVGVEATVASLSPNTLYVYRVIATNASGTTTGSPDQSFATLPNPPAVLNDPVDSIGQTSAVLNAHVDNEGAAGGSSCTFIVALKSAPHSPLIEADCVPNPVMGDASEAVEASVNGLSPNTKYVYRVLAENAGGKSTATPDREFATLPNSPLVKIDTASSIHQTAGVLRGQVDNEGAERGSVCKFVVALERSPDTAVEEPPCQPNPVMGATDMAVEATATGLAPNTKYVYRIAASNAGGSTTSSEARFATLPNAPSATTDAVGPLGETRAVLHGHVDNEGAVAGSSCTFVVALKSAPRSPLVEADCVPNPVMGDSAEAVEASVNGLSPNTTYVYRVVSENEGGKSTATPDREFRSLASNAFGIRRVRVRCNGRIVLWLEAPGSGRFEARATAIGVPHRRLRDTTGSRRRQDGCGGLLQRARAHESAHLQSQAGTSVSPLIYGMGSAPVRAVGDVKLTIVPRRSGLRALRRFARLRIRIALTFGPDGGVPSTKQVIAIFDRPVRLGTRAMIRIH